MLINIIPKLQQLQLVNDIGVITSNYAIATAANGLGEKLNSGQTPRGWLEVRAKIGANCQLNTVFIGRRPTGEIYSNELAKRYPSRDWILTRILWLSGLEVGRNRLGQVDTMQRYIYIHGSPDHEIQGLPNSKGCIRMKNKDVVELFDIVPVKTKICVLDN